MALDSEHVKPNHVFSSGLAVKFFPHPFSPIPRLRQQLEETSSNVPSWIPVLAFLSPSLHTSSEKWQPDVTIWLQLSPPGHLDCLVGETYFYFQGLFWCLENEDETIALAKTRQAQCRIPQYSSMAEPCYKFLRSPAILLQLAFAQLCQSHTYDLLLHHVFLS